MYINLKWFRITALCSLMSSICADGALTLVGSSTLPQTGNLVSNGSFEMGAAGTGLANLRYWATGTTNTPFAVPPGWTSSGQPNTYAVWGSDDNGPTFEIAGSDTLSDGMFGLYFGNGRNVTSNQPPTFHADGTVTFPNPPNFTVPIGGPVVLSQTVNTPLSPAASYSLSFWISGENANLATIPEGIFGFRLTNTLAGDPIQYLTVPSGAGPQGPSRFYRYDFVPLNASLPVTLEFINWGHFDLSPFGGTETTELVLDDVIIQPVPEPVFLAAWIVTATFHLRRVWRSPNTRSQP